MIWLYFYELLNSSYKIFLCKNGTKKLISHPGLFFIEALHVFEFSDYLDIITIRKFRVALAKLRVSSQRLEVEMGRWARPERITFEDRTCKLCHKLEAEFYF